MGVGSRVQVRRLPYIPRYMSACSCSQGRNRNQRTEDRDKDVGYHEGQEESRDKADEGERLTT